MLSALRHPSVCLFVPACMTPPNRAIVTELVSRGSLWAGRWSFLKAAQRDSRLTSSVTMALFGGVIHATVIKHTFGCLSSESVRTLARKFVATSSSRSLFYTETASIKYQKSS